MSRPASLARGRRLARLGLAVAIVLLVGCRKGEGDGGTPVPDSLSPSVVRSSPSDTSGVSAIDTAAAGDAMVALRQAVERELGQPVSLEIDQRRDLDRWTFVTAVARTAEGKPIDYTRTKFADAVKDGVFDDWLCALLERDGAGWKVVALEIGATDVPFVDWPERFGVPRELVLPSDSAR